MQRSVGEKEVERPVGHERFDVAFLEVQHLAAEMSGLEEHGLGGVDAQGLLRTQGVVQLTRQLARPTPQIGNPHPRTPLDQCQQVIKRQPPLSGESCVLLRRPHAG
jgi:hypothetical protein